MVYSDIIAIITDCSNTAAGFEARLDLVIETTTDVAACSDPAAAFAACTGTVAGCIACFDTPYENAARSSTVVPLLLGSIRPSVKLPVTVPRLIIFCVSPIPLVALGSPVLLLTARLAIKLSESQLVPTSYFRGAQSVGLMRFDAGMDRS